MKYKIPRSFKYSSISLWYNKKEKQIKMCTMNCYVHNLPKSETKRLMKFLFKARLNQDYITQMRPI